MADVTGSFLTGTPGRAQQFPKYTPNQQTALDQILQMGLSGLQQTQGGFDFAPIERQARNQFQTQTIPSIAERFTAMGGGQRSGAFPAALGRAGAGLEQSLAALKSQHGIQQQGLLQNLLGLGLTPQFESAYTPSQPGFLGAAGEPLLQGLGQSLPYLLPIILGGLTGGTGTAAAATAPAVLKLLIALSQLKGQ